jgi:nitrogen regulatory protein PII
LQGVIGDPRSVAVPFLDMHHHRRKLGAVKLIIAIVRAENLDAVEVALNQHRQANLLSISEVLGTNREPGYKEMYRGREVFRRQPKCRLEIAVNDQVVDATLESVVRAGSRGDSGTVSDCKAFVLELDSGVICD